MRTEMIDCWVCEGVGEIIDQECLTCKGHGVVEATPERRARLRETIDRIAREREAHMDCYQYGKI